MFPILHLASFSFYTFGLVFGISVWLGWLAFDRYFKLHDIRVNMPLLGVCLVVSGLAGAKLDDLFVRVIFLHQNAGGFASQVSDLSGGYTYFGCLVTGSLAGIIYAKANGISLLRGFDSIFCIGLAYGVGRIGCFLAGDGDYGIASNLPWAMAFPRGVIPTLVRVHPTMLYSSVWELTLFAVLWRLSSPRRRPPLRPGTLLGIYLVASGAGRFLVEFLSRNAPIVFGLKEAQLVSAAMIAVGIFLLARTFFFVEAQIPMNARNLG